MNTYTDQHYFPFDSFNEFVNKIKNGEATLSITHRGSMAGIAQRQSPIMTLLFWSSFIFGSLVLFLFARRYIGNYWVMIYSIALIFNSLWMVFFKTKFFVILNLVLWVVPFLIGKYYWVSAIGLSSLVAILMYFIWHAQCHKIATEVILDNEEMFNELWELGHITIVYNNIYYYSLWKMKDKIKDNVSESQISFCKNCGAKLSNDEKFCHQCGKKVEQ